ncbi:MAG: ATP-binding cassette domain-containing protein, partial [Synergistaceae bacterium]|nr:ATP-binding cassette domain-containing protein [Synergistaceae bacterium]
MLLEVRDLSVYYGDIRAVNGVSIRLDEGELVSVIGANGAGKSSLLNSVM